MSTGLAIHIAKAPENIPKPILSNRLIFYSPFLDLNFYIAKSKIPILNDPKDNCLNTPGKAP